MRHFIADYELIAQAEQNMYLNKRARKIARMKDFGLVPVT
jgi:hypothetical protein